MAAPQPLNQAVIAQALNDLRNGQLRRCKAMGFEDQDLEALKHPAFTSLLVNTHMPWCTVQVNVDVLRRLLGQLNDLEHEVALIDRMVLLGGSTELISHFCGISHQEVALRRRMLDLPTRRGRWPVLDEDRDTRLWSQWRALVKTKSDVPLPNSSDERRVLEQCMTLAEAMEMPLSVIWHRVLEWIEEGHAP